MSSSGERGTIPRSILIVGSGVFGLSTAHSLSKNPRFANTSVTLIDRHVFPAPDGSSIDSSRIIRPDYASPPYARLASAAQALWRTQYSAHYHENGLCVTASGPEQTYVSSSLANVRSLGTCKVTELTSGEAIRAAAGIANPSGNTGYVNWSSGWADAEGAMRQLRQEVEALGRVKFLTGKVSRLLIDRSNSIVTGVEFASDDNRQITADLVILATGAWTPALLDMRGIAKATGQVLCYLQVTPEEQEDLGSKPTLLNLSNGMFLLPPSKGTLKVARHGHGYISPVSIPNPEQPLDSSDTIKVSLPLTTTDDPSQQVPFEGQQACREFLATLHPKLAYKPYCKTRICWYTDTRTGDFLISYHPRYKGLFVATGGSGHAFKFMPVIGDAIVACMMGQTPSDFVGKWEWPAEPIPEACWAGDGSRGGPAGMVLQTELTKGVKANKCLSKL